MRSCQIFLLFFFCYLSGYSQNTDIRLLKDINPDVYNSTAHWARFQSDIAHPLSFALPIGLLVEGYVTHNQLHKQKAATVLVSVVAADLINWGLKEAIQRPRPYVTWPGEVHPWGPGSSYSMPSGHAAEAFGLATSLTIAYPYWYVALPAYLYAGSMAYSRMVLGVHYPSDVLVGAVVGSATAIGVHFIAKKVFKTHPVFSLN